MSSDDRPLPNGWVRKFDTHYNHDFWVDTLASPPRATWVHPFEDEQYLKEHPEVADKLREGSPPPPAYMEQESGPYPFRPPSPRTQPLVAAPGTPVGNRESTSFFKKLKRLLGLGKNRNTGSSWRRDQEERIRRQQSERDRLEAERRHLGGQEPSIYPALHPMPSYPPPGPSQYQPNPPQDNGGYGQQHYQAPPPRRRGGMGGGMLPLLGGLAGGLLLGDLIGGGFDGGDGGFDGGDFGGGF